MTRRRTLVREINPHLICVLCSGYFIEATTIVECLHSFCRSCLVKYLEKNKFCPICDVQLHKNNPLLSVRCDSTLQQLVYKLIPGLYGREMLRRKKYYSELGGPTSDPDCGEFPIGDAYFSPDDSISLSLEFIYKEESVEYEDKGVHHRRYLQCPAAVTMSHLKKFLRMKYGLSHDHNVDIIYGDEVLNDDFSLMDVAYTFSWNRAAPMRFQFRLLQKNSLNRFFAAAGVQRKRDGADSAKKNDSFEKAKKTENGLKRANEDSGGPEAKKLKIAEEKAKEERLRKEKDERLKQERLKREKDERLKEERLKQERLKQERLKQERLKKEKDESLKQERLKEERLKEERLKQERLKKEKDERLKEEHLKKEKEDRIKRETEERLKSEEKLRKERQERREKEKHEERARKERKEKEKKHKSYDIEKDIEEIDDDRTPDEDEEIEVYRKSEERRKEKKKNKKAKHRHRSPPAATILHSSQNDIMKLKIKLNDKKYVVEEKKEESKMADVANNNEEVASKELAPIKRPPKLTPVSPKIQNGKSSVTVSKITAAEKRQMEQLKIDKRPSLEIMLVNAPKTEKKVIRPPPQSIPLSRVKTVFPKSSPPPLLPTKSEEALDLSKRSPVRVPPTLKIPAYQFQAVKPIPNPTVRQIPNPSALMYRNLGRLPPPGVPLRKIETMTRNIEQLAAGLTVKAAVEAGIKSSL